MDLKAAKIVVIYEMNDVSTFVCTCNKQVSLQWLNYWFMLISKSRRSSVHKTTSIAMFILWKNYIFHLNINQANANRKTIEVINK